MLRRLAVPRSIIVRTHEAERRDSCLRALLARRTQGPLDVPNAVERDIDVEVRVAEDVHVGHELTQLSLEELGPGHLVTVGARARVIIRVRCRARSRKLQLDTLCSDGWKSIRFSGRSS